MWKNRKKNLHRRHNANAEKCVPVSCCTTAMSSDEMDLRHSSESNTTVVDNDGHVNDLVQGLDEPRLHNRDIDHVEKYCNGGTFAVFCRLKHPAAAVAQ